MGLLRIVTVAESVLLHGLEPVGEDALWLWWLSRMELPRVHKPLVPLRKGFPP